MADVANIQGVLSLMLLHRCQAAGPTLGFSVMLTGSFNIKRIVYQNKFKLALLKFASFQMMLCISGIVSLL